MLTFVDDLNIFAIWSKKIVFDKVLVRFIDEYISCTVIFPFPTKRMITKPSTSPLCYYRS